MQKTNQLAKVESRSTAIAATLFLIPAIVLIIVYMVYPIIDTFLTSRFSWNGISTEKVAIGMENWKTLIHDSKFWSAFGHNVIVMVFSILLQIPIGMLLATFLDAGGRKLNFFKIIWFLPYLMSSVAIAFLFTYILATNGGLFSTIATMLNGKRTAVDLLGKSPQALFAVIGHPHIAGDAGIWPEEMLAEGGSPLWSYRLSHRTSSGFRRMFCYHKCLNLEASTRRQR